MSHPKCLSSNGNANQSLFFFNGFFEFQTVYEKIFYIFFLRNLNRTFEKSKVCLRVKIGLK